MRGNQGLSHTAMGILGACLLLVFAVGVIFTFRAVSGFGRETLRIPPGGVTSEVINSASASELRFTIRPDGGQVRFYFGMAGEGEKFDSPLLERLEGSSLILENGIERSIAKSVPRGRCFWALRNEETHSINIEFRLEWGR